MGAEMDNNKIVPQEIDRFNWGAFFFSWVWAIRHGVWIGLLALIPFVGLIMRFVLGFKGNEWAWKRNLYISSADFLHTQRRWGQVGFAAFILVLILVFLPSAVVYRDYSMSLESAFAAAKKDKQVTSYFGTPVELVTDADSAILSESDANKVITEAVFKAKGPKKEGYITIKMSRDNKAGSKWVTNKVVVTSDRKE